MDEVELISIAINYLIELGYIIDDSTSIDVNKKSNKVSFKQIKKNNFLDDFNNLRKSMIIANIEVYINKNNISIMDNTNTYIYETMNDFNYNCNSKLYENRISSSISFNHLNDTVIMTSNTSMANLFNGHFINEISKNDINRIEVDNNYKLIDGFPNKTNSKYIVKE